MKTNVPYITELNKTHNIGNTLNEAAFSQKKMVFWALLLPAFLLGFGRGFILPVLPIIARDYFAVGPVAATLFFMAPLLGMLLSTLPCGYLIDRLGRRQVLLLSPVLVFLTALVSYGAQNYWLFLLSLAVNGVALQLWEMGRIAVIADSQKSNQRGKLITSLGGLNRVGTMLGPLLGGVVGSMFDIRLPFLMYAVMALLVFLFLYLNATETSMGTGVSRPVAAHRSFQHQPLTQIQKAHFWRLLRQPSILVLMFVQIISSVARGGTWTGSGPVFVFTAFAFGLSALELGSMSLVVGLISIPATLLAGFLMDRYGRKLCFVPASAMMGFGLLGMAATAYFEGHVVFFLGSFLWANLSSAFMSGAMQTMAADLAPTVGRGLFISLTRLTANFGELSSQGLFSLSLVLFIGAPGFAVGFSLMAVCGWLTALISIRMLPETLGVEAES